MKPLLVAGGEVTWRREGLEVGWGGVWGDKEPGVVWGSLGIGLEDGKQRQAYLIPGAPASCGTCNKSRCGRAEEREVWATSHWAPLVVITLSQVVIMLLPWRYPGRYLPQL